MNFTGSVSYRPVRIGFLVPPDDLSSVVRVARLSTCLWGGRYNPIIPFFETGGERWRFPYSIGEGINIARGYVDFFEPDVLVESETGMAEKLGWGTGSSYSRLPRVVSIDQYYKVDSRNAVQFAAGIDVLEVMTELYDTEFRFERRHKMPFARVEEADGDAFFDVVGGRYPVDEPLRYITETYDEIFSPEIVSAGVSTALRQMKEGWFGPLWITRHSLNENLSRGPSYETFYVFDPADPGDVIDYWNFRLVERRVIPINVNWFAQFASFMRDHITEVHKPIPDNSFGTKFHSNICFASSISDERRSGLIGEHLSGLPDMAFFITRDPLLWRQKRYDNRHCRSKILATSKAISFDEESEQGVSTKIPMPTPSFVNCTGLYRQAHWMNVIVPGNAFHGEAPATVYPSNLWSPGFPRLAQTHDFRVGREGWIVQSEIAIGYSLLSLQSGREAIIGWLKTQGIAAKPSEEGQIAAQVITVAGGLMPSGMFADRATIDLLSEMAESHSEVSRNGKKVTKATPDRSKHINDISQRFIKREKRSFGYWVHLDYFLERSIFRAGVRVQCPICGYHNWLDVNTLSYHPTCTRCLNEFQFSQKPADLRKIDWFYRIVGPFAAPDHARGAYSVALTLRALADPFPYTEMAWSTGLSLAELNCEIDFIAWRRAGGMLNEEREEPLLVIGEAKSFGRNTINDEAISTLKTVAERFPGAVMVVSTLRSAHELSLAEVARLRHLALWGRRAWREDQPINPLIVLTGTELFAELGIANAWSKIDGAQKHGRYDFRNLYTLSELTVNRYVGLDSHWDQTTAIQQTLPVVSSILRLVRSSGNTSGSATE